MRHPSGIYINELARNFDGHNYPISSKLPNRQTQAPLMGQAAIGSQMMSVELNLCSSKLQIAILKEKFAPCVYLSYLVIVDIHAQTCTVPDSLVCMWVF